VQDVLQRGSVMGSEVTQVPNVGVTVTQRIGYSTTGYSLILHSLVHEDQTVSIEVQGSVSTPLPTRTSQLAGTVVEITSQTMTDYMQHARLRSGATLVLSGLDQSDLSLSESGVGSPKFSLLGGGRKSRRGQRSMLILLTPRIIG
jgi:type II secretory pathway component GspD/PulD (secretin)